MVASTGHRCFIGAGSPLSTIPARVLAASVDQTALEAVHAVENNPPPVITRPDPTPCREPSADMVLFLSVFIVGLCTIVYELLIGTVSSYLVGDSVKQFSITIGLSMSAMGIGTWLSRHIRHNLLQWFIIVELALGVIGGLSVPLLYGVYAISDLYSPVMVLTVIAIGVLIGIEIPLLTRIMSKTFELRANISNVLSLDYLGALVGTLLFPFALLPMLGVFRSAPVVGLLNLVVALMTMWFFRHVINRPAALFLRRCSAVVGLLLVVATLGSTSAINIWESSLYEDRVILSKQSAYQKLVLTRWRDDLRLYLNGHLQFSSMDEHRYHESLVHIPVGVAAARERVLLLGGGDGLAVRELLKYQDIREIVVVDLDPAVTQLARDNPLLLGLNGASLNESRVTVVNDDAFEYLKRAGGLFDVIIADLPDPNSISLARLYSREFFSLIYSRLSRVGVFVTQATSPYFARDAFWCIARTIVDTDFAAVLPYHVYVPSMGDWGFVLATRQPGTTPPSEVETPTKFLNSEAITSAFSFSSDMAAREVEPSTINGPTVLGYYLDGWKRWN